MHRLVVVCLALSPLACDSKAADEARAAATQLAAKDKEIAELRGRLAQQAPPADPPAAPPPALGPGRLDPEIVRAAAAGARKLELELEADGSVRKLAVYHDDAAALPAAVTAKAAEVFPGSTVRGYETELYRDLGRVFEVEVVTRDKQPCELSAREDGALVYKECELDAKSLPPEISAAVTRDAAGRKLLEVERKEYADGKVEFIAEVGPAGTSPAPKKKPKGDDDEAGAVEELYFDAAGTLLRRELMLAAEVEIARP